MKFCSHCGKELADDAVFCSACGKQVQQIPAPQPVEAPVVPAPQPVAVPAVPVPQPVAVPAAAAPAPQPEPAQRKSSALANCALVFAIVFPLVGAILGFVGLFKYGFNANRADKIKCIVALPLSFFMFYISLVFLAVMVPTINSIVRKSAMAAMLPF